MTVVVEHGYEAMYRAELPRLVSLATTIVGRRDIANELAQETLMRLHDRWEQVSEYDRPEAWCKRVVTNLAIDHLRSRGRERDAVERLAGEPVADDAPRLHRWNELVSELAPRQRAIVSLYYAEDLPVDEIAGLLGLRVGTVKASLFKARERLRKLLENEEGRHG